MNVKEIMTTKIVTVAMDDTVAMVREIFSHVEFHHLLVTEASVLRGIVSDRDLLMNLNPNIGTLAETHRDTAVLNKKVHQIMSRSPITLRVDADIKDAVDIFKNNNVSCIPILDGENKVTGIISWRDILQHLDLK